MNVEKSSSTINTVGWRPSKGEYRETQNDTVESQYRRTVIIDDILDQSLQRAGVDPNDDLAKKAKQLGKDTLNPFKSKEDLQRDIDELVKGVIGK